MSRVAVVIPAYDEEASVARIVRGARRHGMVIVVDDGSRDATADQAEAAGARVLRHEENRGYDSALRTGFEHAVDQGFEVVVTLDADAQHDPDRVASFVAPIAAGRVDVVLGVRGSFQRPSEQLFGAYVRARYGVPDILCGMKAFSRSAVVRHRPALVWESIGTGLALECLRAHELFETVDVAVRPRAGASRFGRGAQAELRILRVLFEAVLRDVRGAARLTAAPRQAAR
ncbi:MAG: glycosyltransferase family 2 protein [Actinomycetota bacterium]|nr:glycosyltransferase family 2 protein [Actinomycetota bacterium]